MGKNYKILKWDTNFFGFVVGKIIPDSLTSVEVGEALLELKRENVSLVYWACNILDLESQRAAERFGGFLADKKVTYTIDSEGISNLCLRKINAKVEEYTQPLPCPDLEYLALKSGVYSRFKKDPKISKKQFEKLYKLWISNSVRKKNTNAVFVAKDNNKIVGMVTLSQKDNCGKIDLIAVHEDMRGKKIGTSLLITAMKFFSSQAFEVVHVVTQADNIAACCLYEKCGFLVKKTECFYHFWI